MLSTANMQCHIYFENSGSLYQFISKQSNRIAILCQNPCLCSCLCYMSLSNSLPESKCRVISRVRTLGMELPQLPHGLVCLFQDPFFSFSFLLSHLARFPFQDPLFYLPFFSFLMDSFALSRIFFLFLFLFFPLWLMGLFAFSGPFFSHSLSF